MLRQVFERMCCTRFSFHKNLKIFLLLEQMTSVPKAASNGGGTRYSNSTSSQFDVKPRSVKEVEFDNSDLDFSSMTLLISRQSNMCSGKVCMHDDRMAESKMDTRLCLWNWSRGFSNSSLD